MTKRYFVTCEVGDCICELITRELSNDEFEHLTYQDITDRLNKLADENEQYKLIIRESYLTERTILGKSVLRQLAERIGVDVE